jgi:hypothetical protein
MFEREVVMDRGQVESVHDREDFRDDPARLIIFRGVEIV